MRRRARFTSAVRTARWYAIGSLILVGGVTFAAGVAYANVHAGDSLAFVRAAYCSVPGNTDDNGTPIAPGTFLDLIVGTPSVVAHYAGAVPANFFEGIGLTCSAPPAGYVRDGDADGAGRVGDGVYPYYAKTGG
jgi:hypothetical protein